MASERTEPATPETRLFTLMSEIRAEAGELNKALTRLETSARGVATDPEVFDTALAEAKPALRSSRIEQMEHTLNSLLEGEVDLSHYADDALAAMTGLTTLTKRWPSKVRNQDPASVPDAIEECKEILDNAIFHCIRVTIRRDVTWEFESMNVGKVLDFNAAFGAQLRDDVERMKVLDYLKHRKFGGWVDVAAGKIYKLPPAGWPTFLACIAPFVVVALAAGALYAFSLFEVPNFTNGNHLLLILCLVLGGVVAQLSVETVKQSLAETVPILAVSDGVAWLSLRWLGLVKTVLVALGVVVCLRATGVTPDGQGLTICIAAGYSLDSVAGIFLTRFNSVATEGAVAVRTLLAPDPQTPNRGNTAR